MNKTLLATIDFPPMVGGVANYWANLNRHLPSDELIVLAPEFEGSHSFDIHQNYLIYRKNLISKKKWFWPKWLPLLIFMYRLVKRENIKTIIAAQVLPIGTAAYLISKILPIKYIVSVHGMDVKVPKVCSRKYKIMRKVLQKAEYIIANSQFTKGAVEDLGITSDKIKIVYPCPNIQHTEVDAMLKEDIIEEYDLENRKILMTVGRLVERKGHDRVIQALCQVVKRFPDILYVIIGKGCNLANLQCLVNRFNLKSNVCFLDSVDDDELQVFYDLADVFIMTSRELSSGDVEGFGIVYLEANNFKKPVIAGRTGGAVEAVEDGVNGLLVDPDNFRDIYKAIIKLFKNKEYAQCLGENGYERNNNRFNWPSQAEKLGEILAEE